MSNLTPADLDRWQALITSVRPFVHTSLEAEMCDAVPRLVARVRQLEAERNAPLPDSLPAPAFRDIDGRGWVDGNAYALAVQRVRELEARDRERSRNVAWMVGQMSRYHSLREALETGADTAQMIQALRDAEDTTKAGMADWKDLAELLAERDAARERVRLLEGLLHEASRCTFMPPDWQTRVCRALGDDRAREALAP